MQDHSPTPPTFTQQLEGRSYVRWDRKACVCTCILYTGHIGDLDGAFDLFPVSSPFLSECPLLFLPGMRIWMVDSHHACAFGELSPPPSARTAVLNHQAVFHQKRKLNRETMLLLHCHLVPQDHLVSKSSHTLHKAIPLLNHSNPSPGLTEPSLNEWCGQKKAEQKPFIT